MIENENTEFKEVYTENIYKEIVAFLNSYSGNIYIGYNDNGVLVGLEDAKSIEEKISNGIAQKIVPECSMFVSIKRESLNDIDYIVVNVSKGINVYSLKEKGIIKGTYIRNGSCSILATEESVRQMIIKNSNLSFETSISNNQSLTFNYIIPAFKEVNINLEDNNTLKTLKLLDSEERYTNLALLLSDQNPFTIKIAVYESTDKLNFLDRKEFSGSLLEIYEKTLDYLKINTSLYGIIEGSVRNDIEEYPEFVLREIILNSIIHRDYTSISSNIVNLYKNDGIEFINYGSLYGNITVDDILAGLSTSRNPILQSIFMRLKRVEAIGSGLRRVSSFYKSRNLDFEINAMPSSFVVKLPRITISAYDSDIDVNKTIIEYVNKYGSINRKEAEKITHREKTTTANILNEMVDKKILNKVGKGPSTYYVISK